MCDSCGCNEMSEQKAGTKIEAKDSKKKGRPKAPS